MWVDPDREPSGTTRQSLPRTHSPPPGSATRSNRCNRLPASRGAASSGSPTGGAGMASGISVAVASVDTGCGGRPSAARLRARPSRCRIDPAIGPWTIARPVIPRVAFAMITSKAGARGRGRLTAVTARSRPIRVSTRGSIESRVPRTAADRTARPLTARSLTATRTSPEPQAASMASGPDGVAIAPTNLRTTSTMPQNTAMVPASMAIVVSNSPNSRGSSAAVWNASRSTASPLPARGDPSIACNRGNRKSPDAEATSSGGTVVLSRPPMPSWLLKPVWLLQPDPSPDRSAPMRNLPDRSVRLLRSCGRSDDADRGSR